MAIDYTTTALVAGIRRRAMLPTNAGAGLATSDLLAHATKALWGELVRFIHSTSEEHLVVENGLEATYAITAGQAAYDLPARAIGGKARDVWRVDGSGNTVNLNRYDPAQTIGFSNTQSTPTGFYLQAGQVVLFPQPDGNGGTLKVSYFRRPGSLVATSSAGTISAINAGAKTVTLNAAQPSAFTTAIKYDFVSATPPFKTYAMDLTCTNVNISVPSAPVFTMTAALPSGLAVGDYLCQAGEAPVAQVQPEFHELLEQLTAARVLEQLGKLDELGAAQARITQMKTELMDLLTPRVPGESQSVSQGDFYRGAIVNGGWYW